MKTTDDSAQETDARTHSRPWRPPRAPHVRPGNRDERSAGRRWLTTLRATPSAVRESLLGTLSEMRAQLAYLYQADDKVIVRALLGERQIRAELAPLDQESTRIIVVTLKDGDVDRALSSRIIQIVEANLPSNRGSKHWTTARSPF